MIIKTTYRTAIALFSVLFSSSVLADDVYVCQHADSQRIISVVYTEEGSTVPCEVTYEKSTGSQVLWSAQGEEGYCEAKAEAFVEKQRSWGWDCSNSDDDVVADTADEAVEELTEETAMESEAGDEMASEPVVTESETDLASEVDSEVDDSESADSVVAE